MYKKIEFLHLVKLFRMMNIGLIREQISALKIQ